MAFMSSSRYLSSMSSLVMSSRQIMFSGLLCSVCFNTVLDMIVQSQLVYVRPLTGQGVDE
jgi:hypothetical protein